MFASILAYLFAGAIGYLLGSCPNGLLISRAWGMKDIRQHGSGNIGATNVLRVLGKGPGYLVFFLDALKGFAAVRIAFLLLVATKGAGQREIIGIAAGLACILGHTFPVWLRFRGGKGVATSAGVLLGLMPLAMVSVLAIWILLFELTRYVSLASIGAASALPVFVFIYLHFGLLTGASLLPFSILIATVVVWRHRPNIHRLWQGTEQRFAKK